MFAGVHLQSKKCGYISGYILLPQHIVPTNEAEKYTNQFYDRLDWLARDSRNFGWGYDEVRYLFAQAFPEQAA